MSDASAPNTPSSTHRPTAARIIAFAILAMMGIGMSALACQFNSNGPIVTWGIFPGAPFVIAAGLSLVTRIPLRVTVGAYIGGLLAVTVPYGAIWFDSQNYNGGGANIGLGILLLATLILLPIPMVIGGFIGWLVPKRTHPHLNKATQAVNHYGV